MDGFTASPQSSLWQRRSIAPKPISSSSLHALTHNCTVTVRPSPTPHHNRTTPWCASIITNVLQALRFPHSPLFQPTGIKLASVTTQAGLHTLRVQAAADYRGASWV